VAGAGGRRKKKKNVLLNGVFNAVLYRHAPLRHRRCTACVQLLYVLKKSLKVVRFAA